MRAIAIVSLLFCLFALPAPAQSELSLAPDHDEWLSQGWHGTFKTVDLWFLQVLTRNRAHRDPDYIHVFFHDAAGLSGDMYVSTDMLPGPLARGVYADSLDPVTTGFDPSSPERPGFLLNCSTSILTPTIGQFAILDVSTSHGFVERFAIVFEEKWGANLPSVTGHMFYNYSPTCSIATATSIIDAGSSTTATVTLPQAAPAGGALVTLKSSDDTVIVPAMVLVPAGSTSAEVPVWSSGVTRNRRAILYAEYKGVGNAAFLEIAPPAKPITRLDIAINGETHSYPAGDNAFEIRGGLNPITGNDLDLRINGDDYFWRLVFSTGTEPLFVPGAYDHAVRVSTTPRISMDIDGSPVSAVKGLGCNELNGRFTIIDATYDTRPLRFPLLTSVAVDFDQHCLEGGLRYSGRIYYNYVPRRRRTM